MTMHRQFPEFLLHQLVRHLQNDTGRRSVMSRLANWFACSAGVRALESLPEVDWYCLNAGTGQRRTFSPTHSLAKELDGNRKRLIAQFRDAGTTSIRDICDSEKQPIELLQTIIFCHLNATEPSRTIGKRIRRALFRELAKFAFDPRDDSLFEFLLDGYTRVDENTEPSRATLVEELFQALIDLFMLQGRPVVFAFDALENLLGDPPQQAACQYFHGGIANLIDLHYGVPLLVFAEVGHWESASGHFSEYAMNRFQQGIAARKYGSISRITLPEITAEQLTKAVAARMQPLLCEHFGTTALSKSQQILPFQEDDLQEIARELANTPPLRIALQILGQKYDSIVFQRDANEQDDVDVAPGKTPPDSCVNTEVLADAWKRQLRKAERQIEGSLSQLTDQLYSGARHWANCWMMEGSADGDWSLSQAEVATFGNHPTYGQILKLAWSNNSEKSRSSGLAFLLAGGPGMYRDLETKLKMIVSPSRIVDELLILWPKELADEDAEPSDQLPSTTRATWQNYAKEQHRDRIRLATIAPHQLVSLLALETGTMPLAESGRPDQTALSHFVVEATRELSWILKPPFDGRPVHKTDVSSTPPGSVS